VLVLYESADQTPEFASLLLGIRKWDEGEDEHRAALLDKDVSAEWVNAYRKGAASYPWLVIQEDSAGGKVVFRGRCPSDLAEFKAILKANGG